MEQLKDLFRKLTLFPEPDLQEEMRTNGKLISANKMYRNARIKLTQKGY